MRQKPMNSGSGKLACEVCLMEIPRDLAVSDEAAGYVHYFCGESCYAEWREGAAREKPGTPPPVKP